MSNPVPNTSVSRVNKPLPLTDVNNNTYTPIDNKTSQAFQSAKADIALTAQQLMDGEQRTDWIRRIGLICLAIKDSPDKTADPWNLEKYHYPTGEKKTNHPDPYNKPK